MIGRKRVAALRQYQQVIASGLASGADARAVINRLVVMGARYRYSTGTYHLRAAGVGATATAGGHALLMAWMRAAERKTASLKASA